MASVGFVVVIVVDLPTSRSRIESSSCRRLLCWKPSSRGWKIPGSEVNPLLGMMDSFRVVVGECCCVSRSESLQYVSCKFAVAVAEKLH
jgi:hypothetical protein